MDEIVKRVVPGQKYGVFCELIPCARRFATCLNYYNNSELYDIKLVEHITDEDKCQRGPDGKPLVRITPLVPFQTKVEWDEWDKENHK